MSELYRDFIDGKADEIINSLGGTITPAPANAELYRDFLDRKFDDVINAIGNVKVKSFTYAGGGTLSHTRTFPTTPKYVLGIFQEGPNITSSYSVMFAFPWGAGATTTRNASKDISGAGQIPSFRTVTLSYNDNDLTITGAENPGRAFNANNSTYTVYYI